MKKIILIISLICLVTSSEMCEKVYDNLKKHSTKFAQNFAISDPEENYIQIVKLNLFSEQINNNCKF